MLSTRARLTLLCSIGLALIGVLPAAASAAVSVSAGGSTLTIAATNVNPFVTIDHQLGDYVISDGGGASPGSGCEENGSGQVRCDDSGITQITLSAQSAAGAVMSGDVVVLPDGVSITLNGGSGNDIFESGDGDDTLHGGAGSNDLDGADGDDTIDTTGVGSQILTGGDGSDTITGAGGNNIINGGEFDGDTDGDGNDTITGGPLQDNLDGGGGDDVINALGDDDSDVTGSAGNDTLNGGLGDDTLDGGRNPSGTQDTDTLNGDGDDDTLLNSDGADTFNGGSEVDTVDYSVTTGSGVITADIDGQPDDGRAGEGDNVAGTVENLTGDNGPDTLTGNSQPNVLSGEGGDDTLAGGSGTGPDGKDTFDGGTGSGDRVTYAGRTDNLVVDVDGTADDGAGGCPAAAGCEDDDVEADVENVTGGSGSDTITGSAAANDLRGGAGTGADNLDGLGSDDDLFGGTGTNTGPDGADEFTGGSGTDLITYAGRTDGVTSRIGSVHNGAAGCPSAGTCENDTLGSDIENLTGGGGSDTLTGDGDANDVDGGPASDVLAGGTATSGSDGPDVFTGGSGTDQVTYASRTTPVFASIDGSGFDGHDCPVTGPCEKDNVGTDVEQLVGGSGNDDLTGDADNNALLGNGGDDDLAGGTTDVDGRDTFGGGTGSDRVFYSDKTRDLNVTLGGGDDGAGGCPSGAGCEDDQVPADVEEVVGGSGDDTLVGSSENNEMIGGSGDDTLSGGSGASDGADRFAGGGDVDLVTFESNSGNRTVTIDGTGNDGTSCPGASCEGDDVEVDVENVRGGSGNDQITGDVDANALEGSGGDDTLKGGGTGTTADGLDTFRGGTGTHDAVSYADRTSSVTAQVGTSSGNGIGGCPSGAGCEDDSIGSDVEDLTGGSEDDDLIGGASSANTLDGGPGDDELKGSPSSTGTDGADTFIGGTNGTAGGVNGATGDLVNYSTRADALTVTIGGASDGAASEGDDVRAGIEKVTGGSGSDTISGDGAVNTIVGGGGADTLAGGAGTGPDGADTLTGGTGGPDTVSYATRSDALSITLNGASPDGDIATGFENVTGGSGGDSITGDSGPNTITGGLGADTLNALGGADRVEARDGVGDTIDCGTEGDVVVTDASGVDGITGCETVDAAASPPPPPPPDPSTGGGGETPPPENPSAPAEPGGTGTVDPGTAGPETVDPGPARALSLRGNAATLTLSARGQLALTVQAPAGTSGLLTIATASKVKVGSGKKAKRKVVTLAKVRFRVGAGGSVKVPITLSPPNRRLVAGLKSVRTVVTASATGLSPANANLTVKAPKPKRKKR